jgi:hypothetical protein
MRRVGGLEGLLSSAGRGRNEIMERELELELEEQLPH